MLYTRADSGQLSWLPRQSAITCSIPTYGIIVLLRMPYLQFSTHEAQGQLNISLLHAIKNPTFQLTILLWYLSL